MRIERTDTKPIRFYGVLVTLLLVSIALGALWLGGLAGKLVAFVCVVIAVQLIRTNLRFAKILELDDGRVVVHPVWLRGVRTYHGLAELTANLALVRNAAAPALVVRYFTLHFRTGPVVLATSGFPEAAAFVTALLESSLSGVVFPLGGEGFALQHWRQFAGPSSLGVTAGYRHAEGPLVSIFVYGKTKAADGVGAKLTVEFEKALSDIASFSASQRMAQTVSERAQRTVAGLDFLSASLLLGEGSKAAPSLLLLTAWKRKFLKVRVTSASGGEVPHEIVVATLDRFLGANPPSEAAPAPNRATTP